MQLPRVQSLLEHVQVGEAAEAFGQLAEAVGKKLETGVPCQGQGYHWKRT